MPAEKRDFNSMQEEAMRRMREMQKRSKTAVSSAPEPKKEQPPEPPPQKMPQPKKDILGELIGDFKIDPERAMILLMLLILYKNKSDPKLLLALGYILM